MSQSPISTKKMCLQIISLFVSKIEVFCHFLEIASLDFANFAYYIRQECYLTDLGGSSLQKKYLRLLRRYFTYWLSQDMKKCTFFKSVWFEWLLHDKKLKLQLLSTNDQPSKRNLRLLRRYFAYWLSQYMKNRHFSSLFGLNDSYVIRNLNYNCYLLMTFYWWWYCTVLICYFVFWRRQYGKNPYCSCLICLFDSQMRWDPYNKSLLAICTVW